MEKLEDRRKIEQIPVCDKDGRIEYYKILNYKVHKEFLTLNEKIFFRTLLRIIQRLNKEDDTKYLTIFSQVAINRIIDINNMRNRYILTEELKDKSIDFLVYDIKNDNIICCIELNDETHLKEERKQRDILIEKMFKDIVKFIQIEVQNEYNEDELYKLIKMKE